MYDTEFAIVYSAALEATRELYPNLDDRPAPGKIQTAWQEVQSASCAGGGVGCDDMVNQRSLSQQRGPNGVSPAASMAGMPSRLAYRRFFIRFDVHVFGGRPWRVKVTGHASSWDPGAAMPVELRGADKPGWLQGRTEALHVAIYRKIQKYAIPITHSVVAEDGSGPKADPAMFPGVPKDAARILADIKDALAKRDYAALKPRLAKDVLWSTGGGRGVDSAMATWMADPIVFDAMGFALSKCAGNYQRVTCPSGTVAPGSYQLILEPWPDGWKIAAFTPAD